MSLIEDAGKYAVLTTRKRALQADLGVIQSELMKVGVAVISGMIDAEAHAITVKGMTISVSVATHISTAAGKHLELAKCLIAHGLGDMIVMGNSKLGAVVRTEGVETLPPDVQKLLNVYTAPKLGARKA